VLHDLGVRNCWEGRFRKELNEAKHNVCTQRKIPVDSNYGNQFKENSNQACQQSSSSRSNPLSSFNNQRFEEADARTITVSGIFMTEDV